MKSKSKHLKISLIIIVICIFAATIAWVKFINNIPDDYVQVKSYIPYKAGVIMCTAHMPECGICDGKIIDEKCYVPKGSTYDGF